MHMPSKSTLRVALLAAVVCLALPAFAADDVVTVTQPTSFVAAADQTIDKTLMIGGAEVRLKLKGETAFVAVTKGTVDLTYADGSALTTVPEGTGLKIDGFVLPGSSVVAALAGGKAKVSLAAAASITMQSNSKGAQLKLMQGGSAAPAMLEPGQSATVNAPAVTFSAGQTVALKPNQVGKASAGANALVAIGTATGLAVTTQNASASIQGAGTDQVILSKGAVLSINDGTLTVSATAVSLSGASLQLVSTAGNIQIMHAGKAMAFPTGRSIGGTPPPTTSQPTVPPPAQPPVAQPDTATPVALAAEDKKILDELDAWNNAK